MIIRAHAKNWTILRQGFPWLLDQSVNNYLRSNLNKLFTKLVYTLTKHGHGDGFESFAGPYCLGSIFLVTSGLIAAATSQYQT